MTTYEDVYRIARANTNDPDHAKVRVEAWFKGYVQSQTLLTTEPTAPCGCPGTTCRYL